MASITVVNGRYRVQVRVAGHKPVSRYFSIEQEKEAVRWGRRTEAELRAGKPLEPEDVTVAYLIERFRAMREDADLKIKPTSNTHYMLQHLAEDLGALRVSELTPAVLAAWAKMRMQQGAGGYTINMELSQLGTTLKHTAVALGITLPDVIGPARIHLRNLQMISGGERRERRPVGDELERILEWVSERRPQVADAYRVMAITGLRRSEVARIRWDDLDRDGRTVCVRKRKHPRRRQAKDEWVPLLGEAFDLVCRQPQDGERIFELSLELLTDTFTEATRALGIPDLRLHDLRREATSRLHELGFSDREAMAIVGHRPQGLPQGQDVHGIYVKLQPQNLHAKYSAATQGTGPHPSRRRTGRARPRRAK